MATSLASFALRLVARGDGAALRISAEEWEQIVGEWMSDAGVADSDLETLSLYAGKAEQAAAYIAAARA